MANTPVTKDKLAREKKIYFIQILHDIGTFRNEDPKTQENYVLCLVL
jgi:hypothetical protein